MGERPPDKSVPATSPPVLLVEDHPDTREMVATLLAAEGYTVVTARNGMEGLQELAGSRPFLVLLDLMMPVMTGWEFRRAQLSLDDPALAQVPVILLSAVHDPAQVARHLRVAEYIQKPVDFDRLLQSIRKLCPASD